MGSRTTRPLSLPSVDVFPHLVRQREKVSPLFLLGNRNPMVLSAMIYSIPPQHANAVSSARRQPWSLVKEWSLDEYDSEVAYEEIKTILT